MRSAMRGLAVIALLTGALLTLSTPLVPSQRQTFGQCLNARMREDLYLHTPGDSFPDAATRCAPDLIVPAGLLVGAGWLVYEGRRRHGRPSTASSDQR